MNVFTENNIRFRLNSDGTASVELYIPPYSSSVVIPEKVTSVGEEAFSGCTGLTDITIPESVTSIHENAFYNVFGINVHGVPGSFAEEFAEDKYFEFIPITQ